MFSSTTIYQRTQAGRDEVYRKQAGLTQSERLVLIMIDGTASCQEVRAKLSSLKDERFERAMHTLIKKELICEVFLPVEGQEPERIETEVVDRFLQQDPTDPVTIISYDPEEDFAELVPQKPLEVAVKSKPPIPELDVVVAPVPAVDEVYAKMADSLQQEVQARSAERRQRLEQTAKPASSHAALQQALPPQRPVQKQQVLPQQAMQPQQALQPQQDLPHQPQPPSEQGGIGFHWGYWLIGIGLSFIIGFAVAKLTIH